jgi:hypothetical protein
VILVGAQCRATRLIHISLSSFSRERLFKIYVHSRIVMACFTWLLVVVNLAVHLFHHSNNNEHGSLVFSSNDFGSYGLIQVHCVKTLVISPVDYRRNSAC